MAELFRMSVVTSDGTVFDEEVESANIPTGLGSVGVLAHHAPMLCAIEKGVIVCKKDGSARRIQVSNGVASVENNTVTALVGAGKVLDA